MKRDPIRYIMPTLGVIVAGHAAVTDLGQLQYVPGIGDGQVTVAFPGHGNLPLEITITVATTAGGDVSTLEALRGDLNLTD